MSSLSVQFVSKLFFCGAILTLVVTVVSTIVLLGCSGIDCYMGGLLGLEVHHVPYIQHVPCTYDQANCRCDRNADVCIFNLQIEALQTFTRYHVDQSTMERSGVGHVWYFSEDGELKPTILPLMFIQTENGLSTLLLPALVDPTLLLYFLAFGNPFQQF